MLTWHCTLHLSRLSRLPARLLAIPCGHPAALVRSSRPIAPRPQPCRLPPFTPATLPASSVPSRRHRQGMRGCRIHRHRRGPRRGSRRRRGLCHRHQLVGTHSNSCLPVNQPSSTNILFLLITVFVDANSPSQFITGRWPHGASAGAPRPWPPPGQSLCRRASPPPRPTPPPRPAPTVGAGSCLRGAQLDWTGLDWMVQVQGCECWCW
jgi:hypothetical protein